MDGPLISILRAAAGGNWLVGPAGLSRPGSCIVDAARGRGDQGRRGGGREKGWGNRTRTGQRARKGTAWVGREGTDQSWIRMVKRVSVEAKLDWFFPYRTDNSA